MFKNGFFNSKKAIFYFALLLIVSFAGITTRTILLEKHFSHIDDIGIAKTIIERNQDYELLKENTDERKKNILNDYEQFKIYNFLTILDEFNILNKFIILKYYIDYKVNPVARNWTYAPGQFYFTNFLINDKFSYLNLKKLGRLPSLFFNLSSILILILILKIIYKNQNLNLSILIGSTIILLSWENIIYSSQMSNYGSSYFALFSSIYLYLNFIYQKKYNFKLSFLYGIIFGLACLLQYQMLIITICIFSLISLKLINKNKSLLFFLYLGFFLIFILLIWPYFKNNIDMSINWNVGIQNQFLFDKDNISFDLKSLLYILSFYYFNFIIVAEAMLTPMAYQFSNYLLIGNFILILFLSGLFLLLFSKTTLKKELGIFILFAILTWLILVYLQFLTLSPTRHSLILSGLLIIPMIESLIFFNQLFKKFINFFYDLDVIILFILIIWLIAFFYSAKFEVHNRTDLLNEEVILNKLKKDNVVNVLVVDSSQQFFLMKSISQNYNLINANIWTKIDLNQSEILFFKNELLLKNSVEFIVVSGHECINSDFFKMQIKEILLKLTLNNNFKLIKINSECVSNNAEIDWSLLTENGRNSFSYNRYKFIKN